MNNQNSGTASGAGGGMMTKIPMDRLLEAKTLLECSTLVVSGLLAGSLQKAAAEILKPYRLEDELGNAVEILANATINDIAEREHKPAGDGWIVWKGGECPVDSGEVEVKFRNGRIEHSIATDYRWNHTEASNPLAANWDIIAYRPYTPEVGQA